MSTRKELKAITKRFVTEAWSNGAVKVLDEICAPGYTLGDKYSLQNLKEAIAQTYLAFPDLEVAIVGDMIAEGDTVAYRFTMRGTNTGKVEGFAATGKPIYSTGITILRFANGKIVHDEFESASPSFADQVVEPKK